MAKIDTKKDRDLEQENKNGTEAGEQHSGKRSYGKFFLFGFIICLQMVGAYGLLKQYYEPVYGWVSEQFASEPVYYEINDIVVNPAGTQGERYLMISLGLKIDDQEAVAELDRKKPVIRDRVIELLSSRTVPELNRNKARDGLKRELGSMINYTLEDELVRNLFFTKYVMQ